MDRFVRLGNIDEKTMVCSFVYISRLIRADFVKDPRILHKLFATSIFVAYKYLNESDIWFLEDFAKLAGISPEELLIQELSFFVDLLAGKAHVSDEDYLRASRNLE